MGKYKSTTELHNAEKCRCDRSVKVHGSRRRHILVMAIFDQSWVTKGFVQG